MGEIFTGDPLVTAPTPLFTEAVPPVNTAVSVVGFPEMIVADPGPKLVITGGATTVTVAVAVVVAPRLLVTVRV